MKKLFTLLCLLMIMGAQSMAQKFALVDMEYILKNIPAYERASEQLNQVSKKWQAEVDALTEEAQTLYKNYQREAVFLGVVHGFSPVLQPVGADISILALISLPESDLSHSLNMSCHCPNSRNC